MKDGDEIWKIKDERRKINDLCPGDERFQQTVEDDYARYIERPAEHQEIQGFGNR